MSSQATAQKKKEVFISYARKDFTKVNRLRSALEEAGVTTWMDKHNLELGQEWEREIAVHIDNAHVFLACMSKNAVERKGVLKDEVDRAVTRYRGKFHPSFHIIPIRLDDCQLSNDLARFQWFDLDAEDLDSLTKLVDSIQSYRNTLGYLQISGPSVELPPLSVREEDIPKIVDLSETRHKAYDCYIRDRVRARSFEEAFQMAKVPATEEGGTVFKPVEQCLAWIVWWEQIRSRSVSWREIGESFSSPEYLDLPRELNRISKPVYRALADAWRKDLDKSLEKFADLMLTSPNEAIAELQPVLVDSIFALTTGAERSSLPKDGLLKCATRLLQFREKKPQQNLLDKIIHRPLPPAAPEIEEAKSAFNAMHEFNSAAEELLSHLRLITPEGRQELPGAASLRRQLGYEIPEDPRPVGPVEFDMVRAASDRWLAGLGLLWSEPLLGANLRTVITLLEEAGRRFPEAKKHAALVSNWRNSGDDYLNFVERCRQAWPTSSEPLSSCVRALESLITGFAELVDSASKREHRQYEGVSGWIDRASNLREELESNRLLLEALYHWQKHGSEKALPLLKDGTPWFELCRQVQRVHAELPFLEADSNLANLHLEQDILELPEEQFAEWLQKVRNISDSLDRARAEHAMFTCFKPPRFEDVSANLSDLEKCRGLWAEIHKLFQEGKWKEALPTVIDLGRYFAQAAPLREILEDYRHTEMLAWKNLFEKGDWPHAQAALKSALAWLEKARQFRGFGGELLRTPAQSLFDQLQVHYEMCAPAMEAEEEMRKALGGLQNRLYSEARDCLNAMLERLESRLPEQLRQEITKWNDAAKALNELTTLLEQS